jgi:flavorubredoxin
MVSINNVADRAAIAMADGDTLSLGKHKVRWLDAPHLPHGWDNGFLIEEITGTLLCGDLFTQGGVGLPAVTESDILILFALFIVAYIFR